MKITLTNKEIYENAVKLSDFIGKNSDLKLPIRVNFYLQKNAKILLNLAQDIDNEKLRVGKEYGKLNPETQLYDILADNYNQAKAELDELFSLSQDVEIYFVKLNDFGEINLTSEQMQALMFMIQEEETINDTN